MFIAVGLFDHYISRWLQNPTRGDSLDLILLATVCTLLAAKLNQPIHPCFDNMIMLLDDPYGSDIDCKKKLIDLEFRVVQLLEFDL